MQYKIEKWNRKMKSLYKIALWNHSMKLYYEIALWNCIKKSQYEIAIWNRNMKLHHAIANGNGPLYAAGGLKIVTSQIPQIWVLQKFFSYAKRFWRAAASASKSSALSASFGVGVSVARNDASDTVVRKGKTERRFKADVEMRVRDSEKETNRNS